MAPACCYETTTAESHCIYTLRVQLQGPADVTADRVPLLQKHIKAHRLATPSQARQENFSVLQAVHSLVTSSAQQHYS
jgi:hypothetical protein